MQIDLGIIGGTGLYRLEGLEPVETRQLDTPWGAASAPLRIVRLRDTTLGFLARHGENHDLAPHRVNYRANVWAMQALGVRRLLGVNAVGGISAAMAPGVLALPDQLIDYSHGRASSYCDAEGAKVEHVDFGEPYSTRFRDALSVAANAAGVPVVSAGVYGCTQGPRLETRAEVERLRRDGCDLVGMTGMPEAVLARELGLDYACLALVANWAAGCGPEPTRVITMEEVLATLADATTRLVPILRALL